MNSYVEFVKADLKGNSETKIHSLGVFKTVLSHVLNQLHLFLPHETEEINSQLPQPFCSLLAQKYFTKDNLLRRGAIDSDAISKVEVCSLVCFDVVGRNFAGSRRSESSEIGGRSSYGSIQFFDSMWLAAESVRKDSIC